MLMFSVMVIIFGASVYQLRSTLEIGGGNAGGRDICRLLTLRVTFTIKNLSTAHAAGYKTSSSSPPGSPTSSTRPSASSQLAELERNSPSKAQLNAFTHAHIDTPLAG
ncbi:putative signal peptide protein [Puccinia sorghi]|uniref:Putative signal peptide protein n=1 Tax=Puccinia sorghi TaxID=27349 RepID=A0A0L6UNB6_9BASI|nr:putative signal peptide protein [Puccinia sorghi]